ncbi:MAG: S8 family serine peptidase, partial [Phycisphaerales bacterium]|nr:S8 family serine peptidase [Phycisphaerales bacterium]
MIDPGVDDLMGQYWCSFLNENGYECVLFPGSGPTESLDSFAVVIDMSEVWTDPQHALADFLRTGKGVVTWGWAPYALGIDSDPTVQKWIGANHSTAGSGPYTTTAVDSILGSLPPGTELGGCGKFGCTALDDTTGHADAKVLARFTNGPGFVIALMRNRWEGGRSIYVLNEWTFDAPNHSEILLRAMSELSVQIPTTSAWGCLILALSALTAGSIVIKRRTPGAPIRQERYKGEHAMKHSHFRRNLPLCVLALGVAPSIASAAELIVTATVGETTLRLDDDPPFHSTPRPIQNQRIITIEDSTTLLVAWEEMDEHRGMIPMYAVFLDGKTPDRITETNYTVQLRYQPFDPVRGEPQLNDLLRAAADGQLFIVQFYVQLLPEFDAPLRANGAKVLRFMPYNAVIARMDPNDVPRVSTLSFVRVVVPYHPAYRFEERFLPDLLTAPEQMPLRRYSAQLVDNAPTTISGAEGAVKDIGAELVQTIVPTARIELRASGPQLLQFLKTADVLFVDFPGGVGLDMDRVRDYGGADYVEDAGFTGGDPAPGGNPDDRVRGEVMDLGLRVTHHGFQTPQPPTIHGQNPPNPAYWHHGTSVYGIVFGDGTGDLYCISGAQCGRGLLPDAIGIFAGQTGFDEDPPVGNRYTHTSQLVRSNDCAGDPLCPYQAVFQTNSWGQSHRMEYTTFSSDMDQIVFDLDIFVCQSQGNCGRGVASLCDSTDPAPNCPYQRKCSRPQAWAKNVVSVGAVFDFEIDAIDDHRNDEWCPPVPDDVPISCGNRHCGSRGPAIDGRVKPDLLHFGDCIQTADSYDDSDYRANFGATSAATPMTCGYAGLVFQMWHESVFNVWNGTTSVPTGGGVSVFADRPHAATVKAMLINTAYRYPLVTEPPLYRPDFTRDNMGWGIVDVAALYEQRNNMFIVNETDSLKNLFTKTYTYNVPTGSPALRVTMV